jgi:hypothetical protein
MATDSLKSLVVTLEGEESRLSTELATVKAKRVAVAKALAALEDDKPKKRRGRPRKSESTPAETVAA